MTGEGNTENSRKDCLFTIASCMLLLYCTYRFVYDEFMFHGLNDISAHIKVFIPLFRSSEWWEGWMMAPHCLWHLTVLFFYDLLKFPLGVSAGCASCVYSLMYYLILLWVIRKVTAYVGAQENQIRNNVLALCFSCVQPLYFYWLDAGGPQIGPFSINPFYNPTQTGLRGFLVLCFCLVIDILGTILDDAYRPIFFPVRQNPRKYNLLLALVLFLSTVMKPTFAEIFIPAVAFYMLGILLIKIFRKADDRNGFFHHCLTMLLCSVPALLYMFAQYVVFFFFGNSYDSGNGLIITQWLQVWKLFTENVPLSVLLGMAFPIYMILIDAGFYFKSTPGRLAIISYGIGFLEAALLGEEGNRLSHANFLWPMMSGMLILWFTAFLRLLMLEKTQNCQRTQTILLNIGWGIFACHVLAGILLLLNSLAAV